ncbi:hypothetical protein WCE14_09145 [Acinetobacter schindleri]|uniref:hypothetical protein n=1 Tax=Acinetobacter schindleri TaxID=108981 RepID=UPI0034D4D285
MAGVGTFDKCQRQIEGGIKRQQKAGRDYVALDLPYFTTSDKEKTDAYLKQLEDRKFRVEISHTDSSKYGKAYW